MIRLNKPATTLPWRPGCYLLPPDPDAGSTSLSAGVRRLRRLS